MLTLFEAHNNHNRTRFTPNQQTKNLSVESSDGRGSNETLPMLPAARVIMLRLEPSAQSKTTDDRGLSKKEKRTIQYTFIKHTY